MKLLIDYIKVNIHCLLHTLSFDESHFVRGEGLELENTAKWYCDCGYNHPINNEETI